MVLIKWTPTRELTFSRFKDSYQAHKTLCNYLGCPGSDFLSVEKDGCYYTLSEVAPQGPVPECSNERKIFPEDYLAVGATYSFTLKVNPTKKIKGKRVPLVGEVQIAEWLFNRAEAWGVSWQDIDLQISSIAKEHFKDNRGNRITVEGSVIQGVLIIKDLEKFSKVFKKGVGKSKSFGYGMFQLIKKIS